jgi:hypothetical protein
MAKDKKKDRDHPKAAKDAKAPKTPKAAKAAMAATAPEAGHSAQAASSRTAGEHHAATAHGRATKVDTSLPGTRAELMTLHAAARARRNGAVLDSPVFRAAVTDLERIEVRIAAIDRAADPPLG